MKRNIGNLDKGIRIVLGLAIIVFGIYNQSWLGLIGAVPLLTALIGWCPVYSLIGLSTEKKINVEKLDLKN
jgi:hypothetical protein